MTAKEYLSQVRRCDILINQKIRQKEELRRFDGLFATDYSRDKVSSSHAGEASFVRVIERISEIEAEITRLIDSYVDLKAKITLQIQTIPDTLQMQVLYEKYVDRIQLADIAIHMGLSYNHVKRIHGQALRAFEKNYPEILEIDTK